MTTDDRDAASQHEHSIIVEVANQQIGWLIDESQLQQAVHAVLAGESLNRANISLAIVDNRTIHELNRQFLQHDYATDVLSFVLDQGNGYVEGEIIASVEMAHQLAAGFGWQPNDELLLYVIHGTLHLTGYDDQTADAKQEMRGREIFYLNQFGLTPCYEERS
jgi:probable rRNA maturation factor